MLEADELCQRLAVINGGEIVAQGTPAELKGAVADRSVIEIEAFGVGEAVIDRLRAVAGVASVSVETVEQTQLIVVQSSRGAELIPPLLSMLDGASLGKVVAREPTLEDAYIELVRDP